MDLIYTDKNKVEQGVIINYSYDQEDTQLSGENCTFEIQIDAKSNLFELGSMVYIPDTEIGGRIDTIKVDTASLTIMASGKTWKGLLSNKLIQTSGEYFSLSERLDLLMDDLLTTYSLTDLFEVETNVDLPVASINEPNMTDLYTGIIDALNEINFKMITKYSPFSKKVRISFEPIAMYVDENIITSDMFQFVIQKGIPTVTHGICLSEEHGELHRYLQEDGTIGSTPFYVGSKEIVKVFEASGDTLEETIAELDASILDTQSNDTLEIKALQILNTDVGDILEAKDILTGIDMFQRVKRKITTINRDIMEYQYEVGDI